MDNSNLSQDRPPQPVPHQQASLIRVEQVRKLPHLTDSQKAQHEVMIKKFWDAINSNPTSSAEYKAAYTNLSHISSALMQAMKQFQARKQQGAQAAGQPNQAGGPRPTQVPTTVNFNQLTPEIQQRVNETRFIFPPAMIEGTPPAEDWLKEAKARYGHALQRSEIAKQKRVQIQRESQQNGQTGIQLTQQQQDLMLQKLAQCNKAISESESFMSKFNEQQAQFLKQQAAKQQPRFTGGGQSMPSDAPEGAPQTMQVGGVPQPTAHSISSAVSAARATQATAAQQGAATSPQAAPSQIVPNATPTQSLPPNMNQSPYHPQPPMDPMNGLNRSLTHQTPTQAHPQQPLHPQSATHAHPSNANYLNPTKKDDRQPITKNLQVASPKPVMVGPGRPTLTGGPNGIPGQMARPALDTYPGYVLESSDDGRLLSKKKLNELVREVCGPGPEEQLTPEVEELFLQITDDFVDDLITAACKLARLRNSQQLETRDVLVVLERHYNIRIPGYSTDEIRTVRRPQPAPGWAHKMSAVQAAKLTGGVTSAVGGAGAGTGAIKDA